MDKEGRFSGCTIHHLAKTVRRLRFQQHTLQAHAADLHRHNASLALLYRLAGRMRTAQSALAGCFRAEAKKEFGERYAALMTDADAIMDTVERRDRLSAPSWMRQLDEAAQNALLDFVSRIRTEPRWAAAQIAGLSSAGLDALVTLADARSPSHSRDTVKSLDEPHAFGRRDPLPVLLFGIFAPPGAYLSEDAARFDLGAEILASLLREPSPASERLRLAIVDQFADAYGWQCHNAVELLLMSLLQSGTRLLHRQEARQAAHQRANQQRFFHLYSKRDEAEEEFFANALRDLLRQLDSDDESGIPAGALHLGRLVLAKLPDSDKHLAESFFSRNWYFQHFLGLVLKSPESLHLLHDYYISPVQRQTILEVLHQRLILVALSAARPLQHHVVRPTGAAEVDTHCLALVARFLQPATDGPGGDLPILRAADTFGDASRPTFHLCASEVLALAQSLFSATSSSASTTMPTATQLARQTSNGSVCSSKSSRPTRARAWSFLERVTGVEVSSDGSALSEPVLPDQACMPVAEKPVFIQANTAADLSMQNLRKALTALALVAGDEPLPPLAQDSMDAFQVEDDGSIMLIAHEKPEAVHRQISPDDVIKRAIYQLIEHVDLGKPAQTRSSTDYFARRANEVPSRDFGACSQAREALASSSLLHLLTNAGQRALAKRDYLLSDLYHRAHNQLQAKIGTPEAFDDFSPLLYSYMEEEELLLDAQMDSLEQHEALAAYALDCRLRLQQHIDDQIHLVNKLRLKMWYVGDVRRSKIWQQAWEVCKCLHRMCPTEVRNLGSVAESGSFVLTHINSHPRERRSNRYSRELRQQHSGHLTGLYPVDHDIFDALSVPPEQGGSNKLSSSQAELVLQWMRSLDIHNFCIAEERLHRLCFEMDDLMRRILRGKQSTGELSQAQEAQEPASSSLWTFDLFSYESAIFHIPRSARPSFSFFEQLQQSVEESTIGLPRRGSAGDLLNLSRTAARQRGNSVGSIDNPRSRSRTRVSIASENDILLSSPERHGPGVPPVSGSQPLHRQISLTSTTGSTSVECDETGAREFLLQTRIGLTSLLLSDMAESLFYEGGETDEWYHSDLLDAVLMAKKRQEDLAREKASEGHRRADSTTPLPPVKVIAQPIVLPSVAPKRPAHSRMRSATLTHFLTGNSASAKLKASPAPPSIDLDSLQSAGPFLDRTASSNSALESSGPFASSPRSPLRTHASLSRKAQPRRFPNARAYRELFQRFSAHPNPYEKLRTLYEFEVLVVSSLSARGKDEIASLPRMAPISMPNSPVINIFQAGSPAKVPVVTSLRSPDKAAFSIPNDVQRSQASSHPTSPRVPSHDGSKPGTDMIVEEMTRILRLAELRPKTLFRDLQFIATFVPSSILNMTDEGKVFWDFGLAVLSLKQETVETLADCAQGIIRQAESRRVEALQVNAATQVMDTTEFTLHDAVAMLTIAAKERHAAAMRELAIMLCTAHEHGKPGVPLILPPLSSPAEIFSGGSASQSGDTGSSRRPLSRATSMSSSSTSVLPRVSSAGQLGIHFADAAQPQHVPMQSKANLARSKVAVAWFELAIADGDSLAQQHLAQRQTWPLH